MKDFTYIGTDEHSLHVDCCIWLRLLGLRETRWFLDVEWLRNESNDFIFRKWVDN